MTIEERAVMIAERMWSVRHINPRSLHELKGIIAEQIKAACEEVEHNMNHTSRSVHVCKLGMKQNYEKGFAAAIERASGCARNQELTHRKNADSYEEGLRDMAYLLFQEIEKITPDGQEKA